MLRVSKRAAAACGVLAWAMAATAVAQERQVYRYVDTDGRVVYSDRVPPSGAKDVQAKRVLGNTIETSTPSLAIQQATERFPVTLYTFNCGEACDRASGLLNRRGVPYSTVNVEDQNNAVKLQQLTGELIAPVLQVGDKLLGKGFHEATWNGLLDQAGYPKSPPQRTTPVKVGSEPVKDDNKTARTANAR